MFIVQNTSSEKRLVQAVPPVIALTAEPIPQGVASATGTVTVGDSVLGRTTGVTTWNDWHIGTSVASEETAILTNLDPSVGTLEGDVLTRIADGHCMIVATQGAASQRVQVNCTQTPGANLDVLESFTGGSVADVVTDALMALVSDGANGRYYSTKNHAAAIYTRDPGCWAASIDLSAIAVASDRIDPAFSSRSCATAITARHVIGAGHTGWLVGTRFRFVTEAGVVNTRSLIATYSFGDIVVGTLDSALPAGITPMKICGNWIATSETELSPGYIRSTIAGAALHLDQHGYCKWTLLGSTSGYAYSNVSSATINGSLFSTLGLVTCFSRESVTGLSPTPAFATGKLTHVQNGLPGDSGLPLMVVTEDGPGVLWTWLNLTAGPPVWETGLLNAMIAESDAAAGLSTGLTITFLTDPTA